MTQLLELVEKLAQEWVNDPHSDRFTAALFELQEFAEADRREQTE